MPASVLLSARPLTVTVLFVPMVLEANTPVALPVAKVTLSPLTTPTNVALPKFNVAVVLPS